MSDTQSYLKASQGTALAVLILIAATLAGAYLLQRDVPPRDVVGEQPGAEEAPIVEGEEDVVSRTITVTGRFTCLPHKNTDGPQTLECAAGLAADDGENYALDLSAVTYPADVTNARVTGYFTPVEALSSNQWWRYDMRGIIMVQSVEPL